MIDFFGSDNFVDDRLEEVVLSCHPGWKTGDVQLLVANGIIQRQPAVHTQRANTTGRSKRMAEREKVEEEWDGKRWTNWQVGEKKWYEQEGEKETHQSDVDTTTEIVTC